MIRLISKFSTLLRFKVHRPHFQIDTINFSSIRLWGVLYLFGLLCGGACYYVFQNQFLEDTSSQSVNHLRVKKKGAELVRIIKDTYASRHIAINIDEPLSWRFEETEYSSEITLRYWIPKSSINGELLLFTNEEYPNRTLIRPKDASDATETIIIDFDLTTMQPNAKNKEPINLSFGFCIFLSLRTLTTLSPGEIIPNTVFGRLIVSAQSIYGIIISALLIATVTRFLVERKRGS